MQRRDFLGWAVLIGVPAIAGCSSNESYGESTGSCDGDGASTSEAAGHRHFVCVPKADLASPPASGATYTTTTSSGHSHEVSLSRSQLEDLAAGHSVTVATTSAQGHSHTVTFTAGASVGSGAGY